MSQLNGDPDARAGTSAPNPAMVVARRRPASVSLRGEADGGVGALMDPANQSLAEALKITYRLLQVGMIALVVLFVLSGFQSIRNYEKGVRVTFGKVDADDLGAGFAFSWPRPLGEIVRVPTGNESTTLAREFFPALAPASADQTIQEIAERNARDLNVLQDGSLVTRDLNVVHARLTAVWTRLPSRVREYVQNVQPEHEQRLVESALMRGAVHAAAQLYVDEFLYDQPSALRQGPMPDLRELVRRAANESLEQMGAGIEVQSVTFQDRTPPLSLVTTFALVQTSQTQSQKAIETARQQAKETLAASAGDAATLLLERIDAYDVALTTRPAEAEEVLASIDAVLEGREATINGQRTTVRTAGDAGSVISTAQQYRSTVVSRAQGEAQMFAAKLEAFKSNPSVVLVSDWSDAYKTFLERDSVQTWVLPAGVSTLQLLLSRDPDLVKSQTGAAFRKLQDDLERERAKKLEDARNQEYKNTSVKADSR